MPESMDRAAVVSCLNDLIETSRDAENGFRQCGEKARDPKLKDYFLACANDCRSGIDELTRYVAQYGGSSEKSGSIAGAAHRVWLTIREGVRIVMRRFLPSANAVRTTRSRPTARR